MYFVLCPVEVDFLIYVSCRYLTRDCVELLIIKMCNFCYNKHHLLKPDDSYAQSARGLGTGYSPSDMKEDGRVEGEDIV